MKTYKIKTNHTQGPWKIRHHGRYPGIDAGTGKSEMSVIVFGDEGECMGIQGKTETEALANAKLIAVAPKMLDAIFELVRQFGGVSAVTTGQKAAIKEAKDIYYSLDYYPNL